MGGLFGQRAHGDEVVDRERIRREPPDREVGATDRERMDDHVDTGTIGETGVDHRRRLVDASTDLAHDLVDDSTQVALVDEAHVGDLDAAVALDEDVPRAVHHDFVDARVAEELVDRSVAEHVVEHRLDDRLTLAGGQREPLLPERPVELLLDLAPELVLRDALVVEDRTELLDDEGVHLLPQLFELLEPVRRDRVLLALRVLPAGERTLRHRATSSVTGRTSTSAAGLRLPDVLPVPTATSRCSGSRARPRCSGRS